MTAQLTRPHRVAKVANAPAVKPLSDELRRRRRKESLIAYIFIAPAVITFAVFMAVPMLLTAALSFFDWSGISLGSLEFAGFDNYVKLVQDPVFWQSLVNNLLFILLGMGISVALGLFVAVLLERNLPGSSFFRGVFFLPTVLSTVVIGIVFTFLISPVFGVIRPLLAVVGIQFDIALLGDPRTALGTIIFVEIWRAFGFAMFLFVAGLKSLDETLVEAAKLDGASGSQVFWYVTFPQLRPVTLLVATLTGISMLKLFDLVIVMTGGGPQNATEVLTTFLYKQGFNFNEVGYGSAIAVVLLIITFILTLIRFKLIPDDADKSTEVER